MAVIQVRHASLPGNVVPLPGAALRPVRQPRGAAARYRAAHPWHGASIDPAGAPDAMEGAFAEALAMLALVDARGKLARAELGWCRAAGDPDGRSEYWRGIEADAYFARKRAAELLAQRPSPDARRLAQKVDALGVWGMTDATAWGDMIREAVRRDAERLGVPVPRARRR